MEPDNRTVSDDTQHPGELRLEGSQPVPLGSETVRQQSEGSIAPSELCDKDASDVHSANKSETHPASGKLAKKKSSDRSHSALKDAKEKGREEMRSNANTEDDLAVQIAGMVLSDAVTPIPSGTGLVYDDCLTRHACPFNSRHYQSEHGDRILLCHQKLQHYGLIDRCINVPVRLATDEEITSIHCAEYVESFKSTQKMAASELKAWAEQYDSIFVNNHSYDVASLMVGGLLDLTEKVVKGELRNGVTITRPPGHHAQRSMACGYSFFNSVAIAAHMARHKWNCERVLIVDWDVHHGQGVQYFFEEDPSVLYVSFHRFEHGDFWPHLTESSSETIGKGEGQGFNVNIPWNKVGMGDSEYLAAFHQLLLPIAYEFNPDLVLVCCGFDAAVGDPKGEMCLTPVGYAHLTHALMGLAGGKVVLFLEGGYNFKVIGECAAMCTRTLLGDVCPLLPKTNKPDDSAVETILEVIKNIRPFWRSLQYQVAPELVQSNVVSSTSSDKPHPPATPSDQSEGSTAVDRSKIDQSSDQVATQEAESREIDELIDKLISEVVLTISKDRTCLVYDEDMMQHKSAYQHPERPERISRIFSKHKELGLVQRCLRLETRRATNEELHQIHSAEYIERLRAMQENTARELYKMQDEFNSIYLHQSSFDCASLAVGSTLNVVDSVLSGEARNGVAIVRPPGHHAESQTAEGFCFFNTVALAARYAQRKHGLNRVLILDWDVHLGNGILHAFESDPSVLYVSLHRYENGLFFPCDRDGAPDMCGIDQGEGYNVNIAWNRNSMGDAEYIAAFMQVVMPIAYEFCPELVLVSAGFDAAIGDPLGGYRVSAEGYGHMTHMLSSLANGRAIVVLEGGYNLSSIASSMAMCTRTLLGDPCPRICVGECYPSAIKSILDTLHVHQKYWKSLGFQVDLSIPPVHVTDVTSTTDTFSESSSEVCKGGAGDTDEHGVSTSREESCSVAPGRLNGAGENSLEAGVNRSVDEGASEAAKGKSTSVDEDLLAIGGATSAAKTEVASSVGGGTTIKDVFGEQTELFAVVPLPWCPHLENHVHPNSKSRPINASDPCSECGDTSENWVCLQCYEVLCGRYVNEHMLFHSIASSHLVVLSYADLSVWCYGCDSYVHNQIVLPAKRAAHISKFGSDVPGS